MFSSLTTQYGTALGAVLRHDLATDNITYIAKAGAYADKLTKFLIEREWLEKVPGAVDRSSLTS